jgi:hypothetical protein
VVVRWSPLDAQRPMMGIEGKAAGNPRPTALLCAPLPTGVPK